MMTHAALALSVAAFSSCIDLPPGDITDPHYWGDVFLDKYAAERQHAIEVIEPGPAPLAHPRTVLLITGVTSRDYPLVTGVVLMYTVAFVAINLVIDALYAAIDPRIRY